jgi:hypothetical protein
MNLHRLIPLVSSIILLGIGAASARAEVFYSLEGLAPSTSYAAPDRPTSRATGIDATGLFLTSDSPFAGPTSAPSSDLLFFAGVGVIAGALELRKRRFEMKQVTH